MQLSLGISTCPNDTFIYENLIAGLAHSPFKWNVFFADVESLNEMVLKGKLDVAKVSAQIYPHIQTNYQFLKCGGAIGYGCGPLLLSRLNGEFNSNVSTILPGKNTTAALLFRFWFKKKFIQTPRVEYAFFDEVYRGLLNGIYHQGVTIHEHRFTWKQDGLCLLEDLGAFWEKETSSPIPLGIAVARKEFSTDLIQAIEFEIQTSLKKAWSRNEILSPFILKKAQTSEKFVVESHIKMFVNEFSSNIGDNGLRALKRLWELSDCLLVVD